MLHPFLLKPREGLSESLAAFMSSHGGRDEPPPRCERRSKKHHDEGPSQLKSKKTASKGKGAASTSKSPSKSRGPDTSHLANWAKFADRDVICERSASLVDLEPYNVVNLLNVID